MHIGMRNPFRYRGYFYDSENGLYFLESRFYDPETGRFINADTVEHLDPKAINGLNLYAYCGNNPVMNVDPSGHEFIAATLICICAFAFVFGMIGFGLTMHADYQDDQAIFNGSISAETYVANTLVAAAFGALLGALFAWIGPSSFTFALPLLKVSAGSVAVAGTATVTVTGAEILAGVGILGGMITLAQIGKSGGYRIEHHYPNDHDPTHVHISGDDIIKGETKVDLNGIPLKGEAPLTKGAKKAFAKLYKQILEALKPWM